MKIAGYLSSSSVKPSYGVFEVKSLECYKESNEIRCRIDHLYEVQIYNVENDIMEEAIRSVSTEDGFYAFPSRYMLKLNKIGN